MTLRFEGTYTAIVTPFRTDLSIDWDSYERLVKMQLDGGITGVVPVGTTGESPALDPEEQLALIKRTVELCKGKATVLAGTGTSSTKTAIAASQAAERAGADAIMVVAPYYNRPSQEGLYQHFVAVAASVKCPVVVYNVPIRCGVDIAADTLARIADAAPNVIATKEATGNVLRCAEIKRNMGDRMTVLSGDDALTLAMIALGAKGVISVTSNVYPAEVTKATRLALDGHFEEARRAHFALSRIHDAMFVDANPGPAKAAIMHKHAIADNVRGPNARVSDAARAKVIAALETFEASQR